MQVHSWKKILKNNILLFSLKIPLSIEWSSKYGLLIRGCMIWSCLYEDLVVFVVVVVVVLFFLSYLKRRYLIQKKNAKITFE